MKTTNLLLILCIGALIMVQTNQVEGIFFLDLLCASRIEALEREISQLSNNLNNAINNRGSSGTGQQPNPMGK